MAPSSNVPNDYNRKKNKEGGSSSFSLNAKGFMTPLYVEVLELLINNGSCSFTWKDFVNKYDLCCVGMNLKQIRRLEIAWNKMFKIILTLFSTKTGIIIPSVKMQCSLQKLRSSKWFSVKTLYFGN